MTAADARDLVLAPLVRAREAQADGDSDLLALLLARLEDDVADLVFRLEGQQRRG